VPPVETGYTAGGVPTFDSVREKIETRYGTAIGGAELAAETPEGRQPVVSVGRPVPSLRAADRDDGIEEAVERVEDRGQPLDRRRNRGPAHRRCPLSVPATHRWPQSRTASWIAPPIGDAVPVAVGRVPGFQLTEPDALYESTVAKHLAMRRTLWVFDVADCRPCSPLRAMRRRERTQRLTADVVNGAPPPTATRGSERRPRGAASPGQRGMPARASMYAP
jgi:hypothetical protein